MNLDTFAILASSHPLELRTGKDHDLEFIFNPIALPDSGRDLEGSQGFIKFRIGIKSGLPLLTRIDQRVHIYFDFNEPIVTNQVRNTINLEQFQGHPDRENRGVIMPNPCFGTFRCIRTDGMSDP